jgi:hypothetical protein
VSEVPQNDARLSLARNIINQIGDLYYEEIPSDRWVAVRQSTNARLDQFVASLLPVDQSDALADAERRYEHAVEVANSERRKRSLAENRLSRAIHVAEQYQIGTEVTDAINRALKEVTA